jgi:hypothetical protein
VLTAHPANGGLRCEIGAQASWRDCTVSLQDLRDIETFDSELRLVAGFWPFGSGAGWTDAVGRRGGCATR